MNDDKVTWEEQILWYPDKHTNTTISIFTYLLISCGALCKHWAERSLCIHAEHFIFLFTTKPSVHRGVINISNRLMHTLYNWTIFFHCLTVTFELILYQKWFYPVLVDFLFYPVSFSFAVQRYMHFDRSTILLWCLNTDNGLESLHVQVCTHNKTAYAHSTYIGTANLNIEFMLKIVRYW